MEKNGEVRAYLAVVHGSCADEREISEATIMAAAVAFCMCVCVCVVGGGGGGRLSNSIA